jgi:Flp pilus assembly protein TadG
VVRPTDDAVARRPSEGGQILVLGALMMFVLIGFLALVIDIGNAYAQRRMMQNAADAASIAAARHLATNVQAGASDAAIAGVVASYLAPNGGATYVPGAAMGAADGAWYVDSGGARIKAIGSGGAAPGFPAGAGVEVVATKQVRTYFGGVIGQPTVAVRAGASAAYGNAATVRLTPPTGARVLPLVFSLYTYNTSLSQCGGYAGNHLTFALDVAAPFECYGNIGAGGFSWGPIVGGSTVGAMLNPSNSRGDTLAPLGAPTSIAQGEEAGYYSDLDSYWQGQDVIVAIVSDASGCPSCSPPLTAFAWFHVYHASGAGDPRTIEGWWVDPRSKTPLPGLRIGAATTLTGPITFGLVR